MVGPEADHEGRVPEASPLLMEQRLPSSASIARGGIVAWSLLGMLIVVVLVGAVMAAIGELVLAAVFAAMLSVVVRPLAVRLQARGLTPSLAASAVLLLIAGSMVAVVLVVVGAVVDQSPSITGYFDDAVEELDHVSASGPLDAADMSSVRETVRSLAGVVGRGLLTALVGGVDATVGFVAGSILALLISYYLLKDGPAIRDGFLRQLPAAHRAGAEAFLASAIRANRNYWMGRSILSAVVMALVTGAGAILGLPLLPTLAVVTFVGGFIPYIGAFLGGALAALLAVAAGGVGDAAIMIVVVIAANVLLENVLEPKVLGDRLSLHPLAVLVATAVGGVAGGIVGLMLAVPVAVMIRDLLVQYRSTRPTPEARHQEGETDGVAAVRRPAREQHRRVEI